MPHTASRPPASSGTGSRRAMGGARLIELARFGSVGAIAFVVDLGVFNLLRYGPGELLADKPLTAKVLSVAIATVVAWVGNRYWAFAGARTSRHLRELVTFAVVNLAGMAVAVGCLAVSHYLLGLTSPLADNVAANGVGLVLGTLVRYVGYRWLVFVGAPSPQAALSMLQDDLDESVLL